MIRSVVRSGCNPLAACVIAGALSIATGCGGQAKASQNIAPDADASDADAGDQGDAPILDAEAGADASVYVDPPIDGPCVNVVALPVMENGAPHGRMLFSESGELWSVSGLDTTESPHRGGTFRWSAAGGWQHVEMPDGAKTIWPFAGVQALATMDDVFAFGATTAVPSMPEESAATEGCSDWYFAAALGDEWVGDNHGCARNRAAAGLVYPQAGKVRMAFLLANESVPRVSDLGDGAEDNLVLDGWLDDNDLWYLRYTAVGRWHVRSGRRTPVAVLDLDQLRMAVVDGVPPIDGYGAVAVRGQDLWLYGADELGWPVLARIDPENAHAALVDATGLPRPAAPNIEQDLIVHDGNRIWKLRFEASELIVGTLDLSSFSAEMHPLSGDVDAARALFLPAQADLLEPGAVNQELNGFRPPESLRALPIGDGEIIVARQWGEFAAVRISLACQ